MKILSPFKDYYDFVAHQWGGGDPKVIYSRGEIPTNLARGVFAAPRIHSYNDPSLARNNSLSLPRNERFDPEFGNLGNTHQLRWLCVAGKYYLVVGTNFTDRVPWPLKWEVLTRENYPDVLAYLTREEKRRWTWRTIQPVDYWIASPCERLVQVHRLLNAPVFWYGHIVEQVKDRSNWTLSRSLYIQRETPKLGELGFGKLMPPEQLYQELSYFVANSLRDSPDTKPPVEVGNDYKITAAGFDLKTSFRHRK